MCRTTRGTATPAPLVATTTPATASTAPPPTPSPPTSADHEIAKESSAIDRAWCAARSRNRSDHSPDYRTVKLKNASSYALMES